MTFSQELRKFRKQAIDDMKATQKSVNTPQKYVDGFVSGICLAVQMASLIEMNRWNKNGRDYVDTVQWIADSLKHIDSEVQTQFERNLFNQHVVKKALGKV